MTLAKEGGFSEEELLDMPVYRLNAYYHAALRSHDIWTVRSGPAPVEQMESLTRLIGGFDTFRSVEDEE